MTARRPPSRHAPFGLAAALSLALHGAALGAVLWVGLGTAPEPIALETVPMVIVEAAATSDQQPPAEATTTPSQTAQADTPPPAPEPDQSPPALAQTAAVAPPQEEPKPASKPVRAFAPPPRKPDAPTPQSSEVPPPPKTAPTPTPTQSAALPKDSELEESTPATGKTALTEKPPRYGVDGLANPSPAYPWLSRRAGEQGRVVVRVAVDAAGDAGHVEISKSSGHARLDEAALDALRKWKFKPARRGERPVPGIVEVPVTFRLSGN